MEEREQVLKMSAEEINILKALRQGRKSLGCTLTIAAVFAIPLYLGRYLHPLYWYPALIIAVLIVAFTYYVEQGSRRKRAQLVDKDLAEGNKKVIARQVGKQSISGQEEVRYGGDDGSTPTPTGHVIMSYDMLIDGEAYSASEELYMKVREGDTIYFHVAPYSGLVLYSTIDGNTAHYPPPALKKTAKKSAITPSTASG